MGQVGFFASETTDFEQPDYSIHLS